MDMLTVPNLVSCSKSPTRPQCSEMASEVTGAPSEVADLGDFDLHDD